MRTTLDIDKKLLAEAEKLLGETSQSKTVNIALRELVRHQKLQDLRKLLGTMDLEDNWREMEALELDEMRQNEL